jgi:4-hydroxy-2-oxoheptanedioate aldolase
MRVTVAFGVIAAAIVLAGPGTGRAQSPGRLNSVIALVAAKQPVFGLYAPSARQGGGRRGAAPATPPPAPKTPADLARETIAYAHSDFVFDGTMERGVDRGLPAFTEYVAAMRAAGANASTHPIIVKAQKITNEAETTASISSQLNAGASGIMFVDVQSADEVRRGLAAMRFRSQGGTRPDDVGGAPGYWGLSEAEYRQKADLWPLGPDGELVNWTIVESREGLARVREIAAVPGIGVLWPGAGTLRGLFTTTGPDGQRVFDADGWEAAIQQVLAACKEFNVACGYPANENDIETRLQQGFSVFVMGWGEAGFRTVDAGRRAAGRQQDPPVSRGLQRDARVR